VTLPTDPTYSILVPAHNAQETIADALDSVIAQSCGDWECVIVDDGSTDATLDIARQYARRDARFRVVATENRGCAGARNAAAREARGPWMCPLDADDVYEPGFLAAQAAFIGTHPGFDVYSCNVWAEYPDGSRGIFRPSSRTTKVTSFSLREMLLENRFCVIAVFRRELFDRVAGFREHVLNEDWDFWLRAMATGATHLHNPAVLATYRQRRGSMTDDRIRNLQSHREILEDLLASDVMSPVDAALARRSSRHYAVAVDRARLEARMLAGDFVDARGAYLRSRAGFRSMWKYVIGLIVVTLSPRLYTSVLRARDRRGDAPEA
jgi:glycosyltransferase involved in cell wall biosynthesis